MFYKKHLPSLTILDMLLIINKLGVVDAVYLSATVSAICHLHI